MPEEEPQQPWISVEADSPRLTFSKPLADEIGAEDGMRMVWAFTERDGEYQPWIGVVAENESTTAPQIDVQQGESSTIRKVESRSMAEELEPYVQDGNRTRLLLSSETKTINHSAAKGTVIVYRLIPPSGVSYPSS